MDWPWSNKAGLYHFWSLRTLLAVRTILRLAKVKHMGQLQKFQAIFCNTSNQGGWCNQLPRFSQLNPLWTLFWYQLIGIDLFYPYIPKWAQSAKTLRSFDVIKHGGKLGFREKKKKKPKLKISLNFTGFFAYTEGKMTIQTRSVSFSFKVYIHCF